MFDSGWERGPGAGPSRAWSTETPNAALATALSGVEPVDPLVDDGYDAVERLGAWEAIAAWATAEQVDTAAGLLQARQGRAARTGVAQHDQFAATAMELATMARVAPATGEHRLHQALCLTQRLPQTFARLRAGRIAYSHARVLIEQTQDCTDTAAAAVDAAFWSGPGAENLERTPTQTRERVRRIIQRLDPEALRRRAERAREGRTVRYWSDDDGATGVITLRLPADQARGVFAVIDAAAHQAGDPPDTPSEQRRSLGNRRADATVDLILNGATTSSATTSSANRDDDHDPADYPADHPGDPVDDATDDDDTDDDDTDDVTGDASADCAGPAVEEPTAQPVPPAQPAPLVEPRARTCDGSCAWRSRPVVQTQVRVLIPWQTLAGHNHAPAELEGHGPIPAELARRMAAGPDAVLQRLLLDPVTGIARHYDLRRYRPPPSLRGFVEDRDQYCHAPGCRRSARACDLDHVIAYDHTAPDGGDGRTHPDGLRPECRRHHNLKTRGHWHCHTLDQLDQPDEPGEPPAVLWTSPSGHTWIVRSPSLTEPDLTATDVPASEDPDGEPHDHPAHDAPPPPREHPDFRERRGVASTDDVGTDASLSRR